MRTRSFLVLAAIALSATACSSSDGQSDEEAAPSPGATADTIAETTPDTTSDATAGSGDGDDPEFCADAQAFVDFSIGGGDIYTPDGVDLVGAMAESAPEEIAGDFDTYLDGLESIVERISSIEEDDPGVVDGRELENELEESDPDFDEANSRTFEYVTVSCELDGVDDDEAGAADDEAIDAGVISIDGLQQYFAEGPGTADLLDNVTTYGVSFERDVTLGGEFIGDEAEQICTVALDYALAIDEAATVRIGTESTTAGDDFDSSVIFEGDAAGCSSV